MVTAIGEAAWIRLNAASKALTDESLEALSPMVILAPHPDDETLGCGGLLSVAAAQGLKPKVVYLTDGSASHRDSAQWPPCRLAKTRRSEALAALAVLGVEARDAMFLDWPDAEPFQPGSQTYVATLDRLSIWFDSFDPKSLWAPRRGEGHCDHEAACILADDMALRRPEGFRRMDYMVWGWAETAVADARCGEQIWRLPCAASTGQRRRALECHRTQTTALIPDAGEAFLIPEDLAALVDRPAEIFFERGRAIMRKSKSLDRAYFESLYQKDEDPWNFATSPYEQAKYDHTLKALGNEPARRGLEVGCSIGVLTERLAERCERLIATDISQTALDQARRRCADLANVDFKLVASAVESFDGPFDLIVLSEVVYYWDEDDIVQVAHRLKDAMTPDGRLLMVHWLGETDYPQSADDAVEGLAGRIEGFYAIEEAERTAEYRLDLWRWRSAA